MDFIARLSPDNVEKIRNSGVIKPLSEYINGVNRGSANMAKKNGYRIANSTDPRNAPARADPNKKLIQTNIKQTFPSSDDQALLEAIITRHEIYEAQAAERALRKYNSNPGKYGRKIIHNFEKTNPDEIGRYNLGNLDEKMSRLRKAKYNTDHTGFLVRNGEEKYAPNAFSGHMDMDVLFKERKLVDRAPYPQNPVLDKIRQIRHRTGEYQYLDIAGNYGFHPYNINHLERFNKKNARSVLKYGKNPVFVNSADAITLEPLF